MRTTQGQAAFGHNVQTIVTYSCMVKTFYKRYRWTRLLMRVETIYLEIHKKISYQLLQFTNYSDKAEPQCQATPIQFGSPHEAICAGLVDMCLPILHAY
jgi:hypothetical protein